MTQRQELFFNNQPLPRYTKGEEIFNLATHATGGAFSIIMLIIMCYLSVKTNQTAAGTISLIVYGLCSVCLYTMSSIYHGLHEELVSKKVFRIIDHCTIYLLIAGTYTPICVIAFSESYHGILVLSIEWICAIVGITLNALWLNKKIVIGISMFLYLISGWAIIFVPGGINFLMFNEFIYILIGGLLYTIGVIFYALGSKKKWSHSIFHIFVVLGTVVQFVGIYNILLR